MSPFSEGQRGGDACDWFTPTGDNISQGPWYPTVEQDWPDTEQGAECVSLETHFGHRSHLCCFTLDFPGTVALVQTCWWSGNNTGVEPTLLKSHIQVRSWAISYTSANSVIRSFMVLHNPFQDAWISQKSKLLAKKVIVIKKSGLCLLMQISAH